MKIVLLEVIGSLLFFFMGKSFSKFKYKMEKKDVIFKIFFVNWSVGYVILKI